MTKQAALSEFAPEDDDEPIEELLTPAERDAWMAVEQGEQGVRPFARETGRSPGTVSNLLRRARRKVGDGDRHD